MEVVSNNETTLSVSNLFDGKFPRCLTNNDVSRSNKPLGAPISTFVAHVLGLGH